jgi:4'-phosphopantetheinyl transferase superfamily
MSARLGVDVVCLDRIARIAGVDPGAAARTLLSPAERAGPGHADPHRLAAAVATKEAWLKAVGRRPAGWSFPDVSFRAAGDGGADDRGPGARPPAVTAVLDAFAGDLAIVVLGEGSVGAVPHDTGARPDNWAWYGHTGPWLVAAVLR